jgi:hypothetical protein
MSREPAAKIIRRTDVNVAVAALKKINVPQQQSPCAPAELRETPFALRSSGGPPPVARRAEGWRSRSPPNSIFLKSPGVSRRIEKPLAIGHVFLPQSPIVSRCVLQSHARVGAQGGVEGVAREINRLSARRVTAEKQPGRHPDGAGLYLSISTNGGRRWVFLFKRGGKAREERVQCRPRFGARPRG